MFADDNPLIDTTSVASTMLRLFCLLASVSVEAAVLVCDSWSSLLLTHGLLVLASVTVEAVVFVFVFVM